jgi:hypothetical protein
VDHDVVACDARVADDQVSPSSSGGLRQLLEPPQLLVVPEGVLSVTLAEDVGVVRRH